MALRFMIDGSTCIPTLRLGLAMELRFELQRLPGEMCILVMKVADPRGPDGGRQGRV